MGPLGEPPLPFIHERCYRTTGAAPFATCEKYPLLGIAFFPQFADSFTNQKMKPSSPSIQTNTMKKFISLLAVAAAAISLQSASANLVYDGNFQAIGTAAASNPGPVYQSFYTGTPVAGWQTSNPSGLLEVWNDSVVPGYNPPAGSTYFAELNSNMQASMYQIVTATNTDPIDFYFSHRGRDGVDTAGLSVWGIGSATSWTPGDGTLLYQTRWSSVHTEWSSYSVNNLFAPVTGQNYVMVIDSIDSSNGDASYGNLIGDVRFGDGVYQTGGGIIHLSPQSFATSYFTPSAAVPEPGQVAASLLLLAGIGGYVFVKRRKAAKPAVAPIAA